jgi:hypothetical protein
MLIAAVTKTTAYFPESIAPEELKHRLAAHESPDERKGLAD